MSMSIPVCPNFNGVSAFRYPVCHRAAEFSCLAGQSVLGIFAPHNDCLGLIEVQTAFPPNAATAIAAGAITDSYLTSLLTPVTTSGASNALSARWTRFCVEFMVSDALASVSSTLAMMRWTQPGVPTLTGNPPEFFSVYKSLYSSDELVEAPCAQFTHTQCLHTGMQERSALDFTPITLGAGAWSNVYGNTAGTTQIGNYNAPWSPIVAFIGSATAVTIRVIIRGEIEVIAPPNNFLSRLHKPLPLSGVGGEEKWWLAQRALKASPLRPTDGPNRQVKGYLGQK